MVMERTVQKPLKIEDGVHEGIVIGIESRTKPYSYVDVVLEFKQGNDMMRMKAGYADFLATESKLGLLLARFGVDVSTPGTIIRIEEALMERKCRFQTVTNKKGYADVVPESLKPWPYVDVIK